MIDPTLTTLPEEVRRFLPESSGTLVPHCSEEEYLRLTDTSRSPLEFTDGVLEGLSLPTDRHQAILEFLYRALQAFLSSRGGRARVMGLRVRIRPGKYREPDVVALLDPADPRKQDRFWTGADVAVEVVSADDPDRDLVEKRRDYAEGGVAEYWIVDPREEAITLLRLEGATYREVGVFRRGDRAASAIMQGFVLDVGEVFDAD